MPYTAKTAVSGTTSFPVLLTTLLTVPKLVTTIENNVPGKSHWRRAGYVQAVALTNIGQTAGRSQLVLFGQQELDLEIPAYPYQLRFEPCHYVIKYSLYLYEKDKAWTLHTFKMNGSTLRMLFYTVFSLGSYLRFSNANLVIDLKNFNTVINTLNINGQPIDDAKV